MKLLNSAIASLALTLSAGAQAQWTAINLNPTGAPASFAASGFAGQQVGSVSVGGENQACIWAGTAASCLIVTPPEATGGHVSSTDGVQQAGSVVIDELLRASLWSGSAGSWVNLHPAGAEYSSVGAMFGGWQGGRAGVGGFEHASLWNGSAASWIDLHPPGATSSAIHDIDATQQVGHRKTGLSGVRATLWNGTAGSWIDLSDGLPSIAYALGGGRQVGYVSPGNGMRACYWTGTAASRVEMHPAGATASVAWAAHENIQAGYAQFPTFPTRRASLWYGSAASWVDLHSFLPFGYVSSIAYDVWTDDGVTCVVGIAQPNGFSDQAVMWVSNEPVALSGVTLLQGIYVSGGLNDLLNSDNLYYRAMPNYQVPRGTIPLQIEMEGTSPRSDVASLKMEIEVGTDTGSGGLQVISQYNYLAGAYEVIDQRSLVTSDTPIQVVLVDTPSKYVHPSTKAVKTKIAIYPPFSVPRTWSARLDKMAWAVTR